MFAQIPGLRKTAESAAVSVDFNKDARLEPVVLYPSALLKYALLFIHLAMALCVTLAVLPQLALPFFKAFEWWAFWLLLMLLLPISLGYHYRQVARMQGALSFSEYGWLLRRNQALYELDWAGDALVWRWLIVLRLRDKATRKPINLVFLGDNSSAEDRHRLAVWLRTLLGRSQH